MKYSVRGVILVLCLISSAFAAGEDCGNESYLLCYSSEIFQNLFEKLNHSPQPLVIFPGVEIVSSVDANELDNPIDSKNDSIIGRMTKYLQHHEIAIKLSTFLDTNKLMETIGGEINENHSISGRKKDGKMYMVAISLMFGKLLAVLGIGSIGTLAMKALGLASMALLMTGIVGLKSLYQGNEQSSHHVQYVSEGHSRRRRQVHPTRLIPLPYRGWMKTSSVQ